MRRILIACNVFLLTSVVILIYGLLQVPSEIAHRIIILLSFFLIIVINGLWIPAIKSFFANWGRWSLLFISNLVIQLTVLYTGGLYSPFLLFFHFFTLGISFIFSFPIALIFLLFSLVNLTVATLNDPSMMNLLLENPTMLIMYGISFIVFVPIAQVLSHQYHIKDKLLELLKYQVTVEGAIIKDLSEMVFLIDTDFKILSLNDAAERAIQKNRIEVLNRNIFDVLFLKNFDGALISANEIHSAEILEKKKTQEISDVMLISTNAPVRKVHLYIKPIISPEGDIDHISFIISDYTANSRSVMREENTLEEAELRLSALVQDLVKKTNEKGMEKISTRLLLVAKTQQDIQSYYTIEKQGIKDTNTYVDIASLCRQLVADHQQYAQLFSVSVHFTLDDATVNNLAPFIANALKISPEQTTGPFFSVKTNVKYFSLLIQKIIDISILIASHSRNPNVTVTVGHDSDEIVTIKVTCGSFPMTQQQQSDLYVKYYGSLRNTGNFQIGSGLEGDMVKTISSYLDTEINTEYDEASEQHTFTVNVKKNVSAIRSVIHSVKQ